MSCPDRIGGRTSHSRMFRRSLAAVVLLVSGVAMSNVAPASAVTSPYRIDLQVLLLDDDSPWVDAIQSQMAVEGVPFTSVPLASPSRPAITEAFLSSGDEAYYQAVVAPSYTIDGLTDAERTSLRAFEAKFVDNHNGTARIAGTPARGASGMYTVVFTATNTLRLCNEDAHADRPMN